MPIETDSNDKVIKLAEMNNSDALAELGIRYLGGIFENTQDVRKAKNNFTKAAAAGNEKAEAVISAIQWKELGEEELPAMMTALAEYYRDKTLENDQIPTKKEEAALEMKLSLYWYYSAVAFEYLPALYSLADFYYMKGGQENNERAAVLFCTCAGVESEYADKSVVRLHKMLTNGWLSESWNCYSDVLFILTNYSDYDISEYNDSFDENAEVDDITSDKLLTAPNVYPLEAENNKVRRYGNIQSKRDVYMVLLSMGIKVTKRNEGKSCRIALSGNKENVEKLMSMGYRVVEGTTGYTVYEKKARPATRARKSVKSETPEDNTAETSEDNSTKSSEDNSTKSSEEKPARKRRVVKKKTDS